MGWSGRSAGAAQWNWIHTEQVCLSITQDLSLADSFCPRPRTTLVSACLPLSQDSQVPSTGEDPFRISPRSPQNVFWPALSRVDKGSDTVVRQQNFFQLKGKDMNKPV